MFMVHEFWLVQAIPMVTIDSPLMYDICALFYTDLNSLAYILIFVILNPYYSKKKITA